MSGRDPVVSISLHPSFSFAEFPYLPPEPAAGWQRPPPRQWTPAKVESRGAHALQHHQVEWVPRIQPGLLTMATVPLPAQGPGGYSRGRNSSAQEWEPQQRLTMWETTCCLQNIFLFCISWERSGHPVKSAGWGPSVPIHRLRKERLRRMKSLPWGHPAGGGQAPAPP